jgi:hypothetical protein
MLMLPPIIGNESSSTKQFSLSDGMLQLQTRLQTACGCNFFLRSLVNVACVKHALRFVALQGGGGGLAVGAKVCQGGIGAVGVLGH